MRQIAIATLFLCLAANVFSQTATITVDETYSSSYKATVTVTNTSSTPVSSWIVRLNPGAPIRTHWNGDMIDDESSPSEFLFAIANNSSNGDLDPGESESFGIIVDPSTGTVPPTSAPVEFDWETATFPDPNYIFYQTVDEFPTGSHDDSSWLQLWSGTTWTNGPDEGRVGVDETISVDGSGKSIQVSYPQGGQKPGDSGAQWFMNFGHAHEELYMSYWVRFDEDFDFVIGGKLPGLGGANSFNNRSNEWSGRLMWREDGKAEFYIHVPVANDHDPGVRFWWNTEGFQATFVPGRWHHIELHFRLNTPGEYDGLMEGWFDGVKAADYPNFYFRDAVSTSTATIAWGFFSTFFGGSSSPAWEATKDERAHFDDLIISQQRIGYPGLPDDIDSDGLPNTWEIEHFGSDTGAQPDADEDGDELTNLGEYLTVTDPQDPADSFVPTISRSATGAISMTGAGVAGRAYTLKRSPDLENWQTIDSTAALPSDQAFTLTDPTGDIRSFYRVDVELSQ